MKKFLITEYEKKYIIGLYNILNEQSYGYDSLRASEVEPKQQQPQPPIGVKLIEEIGWFSNSWDKQYTNNNIFL